MAMHAIEGYTIEPLTAERFGDLELILGRSGISGCWCMYWTVPTTALWGEGAKGGSRAPNRDAFLAIVEAGPPPGLIAYLDGEPVGWCRVMRRIDLPGLANSRYFKTDLEISNVWSLPCFVVRRKHRGSGLTNRSCPTPRRGCSRGLSVGYLRSQSPFDRVPRAGFHL